MTPAPPAPDRDRLGPARTGAGQRVPPPSTRATRHSPTVTCVVAAACNAIVPCAPFVARHVIVQCATAPTAHAPTPPVRAASDRQMNVYPHAGTTEAPTPTGGATPAPAQVNEATRPDPPSSGSPTGSPIDQSIDVNTASAVTVNPPALTDAVNAG